MLLSERIKMKPKNGWQNCSSLHILISHHLMVLCHLQAAQSTPWLLMTWQCKDARHQQLSYWPSSSGIFPFQKVRSTLAHEEDFFISSYKEGYPAGKCFHSVSVSDGNSVKQIIGSISAASIEWYHGSLLDVRAQHVPLPYSLGQVQLTSGFFILKFYKLLWRMF